ncbi:hypothetical protein AMECASPLE_030199 [Ameca splendens]|uniref:Uncharacterized protein n=1 Tax=Ameca splendens TaxID=208324 RepID=A0ABV0YT03_9TELE
MFLEIWGQTDYLWYKIRLNILNTKSNLWLCFCFYSFQPVISGPLTFLTKQLLHLLDPEPAGVQMTHILPVNSTVSSFKALLHLAHWLHPTSIIPLLDWVQSCISSCGCTFDISMATEKLSWPFL